jgi:site-specific DNA-methyltransferase (adenine-specific)
MRQYGNQTTNQEMNMKIDQEFKALIPPLTPEEYSQLEANLIADGCRDPLVVWAVPPENWWSKEDVILTGDIISDEDFIISKRAANQSVEILHRTPQFVYLRTTDKDEGISFETWDFGVVAREKNSPYEVVTDAGNGSFILVDGHNRFEICSKHNIPFETKPMFFESRDAVMDWMDANQLGRRNISPDTFKLLLGRRYNRRKKNVGAPEGNDNAGKNNVPKVGTLRTAEQLAEEHGVSKNTVIRAGKFAEEVEKDPELQEAITQRKPAAKVKKERKERERKKRIEKTKQEIAIVKEIPIDFFNQDWQVGLSDIDDGSIALLLTDPPYGMSYRSNYRQEKHKPIEGDQDCSAFADLVSSIGAKLKTDAHLLAFVNWRNEAGFIKILDGAGFTVKSSLVWVKNNTGMGDLVGAFAPKHERIIHAAKGKPKLYFREADVLFADRIATDNHPTEKPVDLLKKLIAATTLEGDLVCDPFAGVASTLVAARNLGRRFIGFEIDADYHAIGTERLNPSQQEAAA